eukprot:7335736-Lingulodinium_polyedra.AAC.1
MGDRARQPSLRLAHGGPGSLGKRTACNTVAHGFSGRGTGAGIGARCVALDKGPAPGGPDHCGALDRCGG